MNGHQSVLWPARRDVRAVHVEQRGMVACIVVAGVVVGVSHTGERERLETVHAAAEWRALLRDRPDVAESVLDTCRTMHDGEPLVGPWAELAQRPCERRVA